MKKLRKKYITLSPKPRIYKRSKGDFLIGEVCDFLERFLNDDFEVLNDVEKNKFIQKCPKNTNPNILQTFDGLNETQSLILSAAIIGVRVILKYCKGEKPHKDRVKIWKKGLEIIECFENRGLLNEKKICYFTCGEYIFRCRVYDADGLGEIILPEQAFNLSWMPEVVGDYNRPPKLHPPMPPLMSDTGGVLKKQAAKMIKAYKTDLTACPLFHQMTKRELIDHCLTYPAVYEDYPFDKTKTTAVIRHTGNKKMFALISHKDEKLYINLKCDPIKADLLRSIFKSVTPGWHMNKEHWNTVYIGGDVPEQELQDMIRHSYDLTKPK